MLGGSPCPTVTISASDSLPLSRTSHILQSKLPVAATFATSLSSSSSEVSLLDSNSGRLETLRKLGGGKGRDLRSG